jgi:uracil-DNA glycosylase
MTPTIDNDWQQVIGVHYERSYFIQLQQFLQGEYERGTVYPEARNLYRALQLTPYAAVKAVILGQDPYHGPGQAHGLSFSVKPGVAHPPSLRNIFKELQNDLGHPIPKHGCLTAWAEQGVLLLNTILTVRDGKPNSHKNQGWETFTDGIIDMLNARNEPVAFVLWGNQAQAKSARIDEGRHFVIRSAHPSPLSARRGFFGSRPFSRINTWLVDSGLGLIDWSL